MIKIALYNVHEWIGSDKQSEPKRSLNILNSQDLDIIGLTEVAFSHSSKEIHPLNKHLLEKITNMNAVLGYTLKRNQASYGNVILSKHEIKNIKRHDISVPNREPRGVLEVDLKVKDIVLRVLLTHFGLKKKERKQQADFLIDIIKQGQNDNLLVMGDINAWIPGSIVIKKINSFFGKNPAPRTYPSFFPIFALDRIWLKSKKSRIINCQTIKTYRARKASDHLPVIVEVGY